MLGRSYSTVLPIAEELAQKGFALSPIPSSIMSELCGHSIPVAFEPAKTFPRTTDPANDVGTYGMMVDWNTQGESGIPWGGAFDHSSHSLGMLLKTQVGYIRNVVVPRVMEFTKESAQFLQDLGNSNPAQELEIVRAYIPEVVQESAFLSLLENFKMKSMTRPRTESLNFNLKEEPTDFGMVASTSNARLDNLVGVWNRSSPINYLKCAWYSFFASRTESRNYPGPYFLQDDLFSSNLAVRLNVSLAYFLIANYYSKHLPDMETSDSSAAIKDRLYDHLSFAGACLSSAVRLMDENDKSNILVLHIDKFRKTIVVSGFVYDRWLATGGKADTIMGILVGERKFNSVSDIDNNSAMLTKTWNDYVNIYLESIEYKKADSLRAFYLSLLMKYLSTDYNDPKEMAFKNSNVNMYEGIQKKAEAWLRTIPKAKLGDISFVARELLCNHKYFFTYAKKFLEDMERSSIANPKIIAEEAAMTATLNYIVDFLQTQIRAVKS